MITIACARRTRVTHLCSLCVRITLPFGRAFVVRLLIACLNGNVDFFQLIFFLSFYTTFLPLLFCLFCMWKRHILKKLSPTVLEYHFSQVFPFTFFFLYSYIFFQSPFHTPHSSLHILHSLPSTKPRNPAHTPVRPEKFPNQSSLVTFNIS